MARQTQVILVADIDGGGADDTVLFGLDGVNYEIDLSSSNAKKLRDSLAPWVGNARRVSGRAARGRGRGSARGAAKTDLGEVRAWARKNGYDVSDRGRVAATVMEAYDAAH
jgi:hypothetical protein